MRAAGLAARGIAALGFAALLGLAPPGHAKPTALEEDITIPVPPIPPEHPPSDVAAPVPNIDLQAPVAQPEEGTQIRPTLNEHAPVLPGGDPVPGTLYRSEEEQKRQFVPNPGIRVVVPLQK